MAEARGSRPASELPVLVVGAGFAGLAAAWAAARAGVKVHLVHSAAGASALYSGIADGPTPGAETLELSMRLGLSLGSAPRAVPTREGVVRLAMGRDRAVLDLEALSGRRIAVADVGRDDWDARLLAQSFTASAWARRTRTEFLAVPVPLLSEGAERRIAPYDFARRFDDQARLVLLGEALRKAEPDAAAWLLGPWLGVETEAASQLAAMLSRPVGEVSSAPGGAAGARFELRRDEVLRELSVDVRVGGARAVLAASESLWLELEDNSRLEGRAVVLALGGVVAGGVVLRPEAGGDKLRFQLSLAAPATLRLDSEAVDAGSSLWGPSFHRLGMAALERVGVRADAVGRVSGGMRCFAAGDLVAGRPRTVLEALNAGIVAGRGAASEP
jgi:anaerobic glycerol-3-phosphate dehydrogenase